MTSDRSAGQCRTEACFTHCCCRGCQGRAVLVIARHPSSAYKPKETTRERDRVLPPIARHGCQSQLPTSSPFFALDRLLGFLSPCPVYSPELVQLLLQLPSNHQSIIPMYQTSLAAFPVVLPHAALPPSLRRRTRFKKRPVFAL